MQGTHKITVIVNDSEGDLIWFYINWGDGTGTGWLGPYESGEEINVNHTWYENGTFDILAKTKDVWGPSYWSHHYIVIGNIPPYAPTITGPYLGEIGETLSYTFKAIDNDGDQVSYYIDWGDGTITDWTPFQGSGTTYNATHAWNSNGDYNITAKAKDIWGNIGDWSQSFKVRIGDQPPNIPVICGPVSPKKGVNYDYTIVTTDPNDDDVFYYIDWGDGVIVDWIGPFASGLDVSINHTYYKSGWYLIRCKAKDIYGKESDWGNYLIRVPPTNIAAISINQQINPQSTTINSIQTKNSLLFQQMVKTTRTMNR